MFGMLPAYGFFIRHAAGIELSDVGVGYVKEDTRPAFVLDDVKDISLSHVKAKKADGVPEFVLMNVARLSIDHCAPAADAWVEKVARREM